MVVVAQRRNDLVHVDVGRSEGAEPAQFVAHNRQRISVRRMAGIEQLNLIVVLLLLLLLVAGNQPGHTGVHAHLVGGRQRNRLAFDEFQPLLYEPR